MALAGSQAGYLVMVLPQMFLFGWVLLPPPLIASHVGNGQLASTIDTKSKASEDCASIEADCYKRHGPKRKRLIHLPVLLEVDLTEAGILIADEPPFENEHPVLHTYEQQNNNFEKYLQQSDAVLVQQGNIPLASRHPTKPVYHYTPLPPGTFRVHSNDKAFDETSSISNEYMLSYLLREENRELNLGRREIGDVRSIYQVLLPDRRMQVVEYCSDWTGYHPTITYTYT